MLLAVGATIPFARKTNDCAAFPLLLVVGIPCAPSCSAWAPPRRWAPERLRRWHGALMIAGVLLSVLAFGQLWDTAGVDTHSSGFGLLLFGCSAALAAHGAFGVGAAYQALLAAVSASSCGSSSST